MIRLFFKAAFFIGIIFCLGHNTLASDSIPAVKQEIDSEILETEQQALEYVFKGDFANALMIFDSIYRWTSNELLENTGSAELKTYHTQIIISLGAVYEELGDRDKAVELYMQALDYCGKLDYNQGKARIYNNLGKISYLRSKIEEAQEYFNKSLEINLKIDNKQSIADNYNNLASLPMIKKEYRKALEYCFQSLEISQELNKPYDVALVYSNIAIIYKQYDLSLIHI